jgi:hypothetical protein
VDLYNHAAKHFDTLKSVFDKAGVKIILYADGCPHPGEAVEDTARALKYSNK